MKAITIFQPYASLISNPPHLKRVENRAWATSHRGLIAIHAGKSKAWLETCDYCPEPMPFGAVVAVAELVDCAELEYWTEFPIDIPGITGEEATSILLGEFAEGPFCWIFKNIRPLFTPVGCTGFQKIWNLTRDVEDEVIYRLENKL